MITLSVEEEVNTLHPDAQRGLSLFLGRTFALIKYVFKTPSLFRIQYLRNRPRPGHSQRKHMRSFGNPSQSP